MPFLYYGLVVIATAAVVLAVCKLIIVRWCATQYRRSREANQQLSSHRRNLPQPPSSGGGYPIGLKSSFTYKKGIDKNQLDYDMKCSVCLSVFDDGEEVRKLPRCKHSFHAACIDMWLYSHLDCPLCRAPVVEPPPQHHRHTDSEHSRDGLLDRPIS